MSTTALAGSQLLTTAGYDPDGNALTNTTQLQGQQPLTDTYGVNATDWLTATSNTSGVGSTRSYTYSYDAAGQQRVQQIVGNASAAYTTTLDNEGRATSLSEAFLPGTPFTATWTYNQDDEPLTAALSQTVQQGMGYAPTAG